MSEQLLGVVLCFFCTSLALETSHGNLLASVIFSHEIIILGIQLHSLVFEDFCCSVIVLLCVG